MCSEFLNCLLSLRFSTRFFTSPFNCVMPKINHDDQVKDVTVLQPDPGYLWLWASDGSLWVHLIVFIGVPPKINTNFVTTLRLQKGKYLSPCPHVSMGVIFWLSSAMSLLTNHVVPIARSFDPIVTANNERCSIPVPLVSVD